MYPLRSQLGDLLRYRHERYGATEDLEEALLFLRIAVEAAPIADSSQLASNSSHWVAMQPGALSNLRIGLQARYDWLGRLEDLDEAITVGREATEQSRETTPEDLASFLALTAQSLVNRFERSHQVPDLEEAIEKLRESLALAPEEPDILCLLGTSLRYRFGVSNVPADLQEAIECGRAAQKVAPDSAPALSRYLTELATSLCIRHGSENRQRNAKEALAVLARAVNADTAPPLARIRAARTATTHFGVSHPQEVAEMLETAVRLLPEAAGRHLGRADQQHILEKDSTGLASDAAALVLQAAAPGDPDAATLALRLLEAGRAILLSLVFDTRSDLTELHRSHPALARQYDELTSALNQEPAQFVPAGDQVRQSDEVLRRRELDASFRGLLDRIRALPGFAAFAQLPDTRELLDQAADGPIVTLNVSSFRSDALILTQSGISAVPLPGLGHDLVGTKAAAFQNALATADIRATGAREGRDLDMASVSRGEQQTEAALEEILAWLWDVAVDPVLDALGFHGPPAPGLTLPQVWWAPGGALGTLPLHAAGRADSTQASMNVIDRVVSSYTPNIRALQHAREQERAMLGADIDTTSLRSLIVAMPTTPATPSGCPAPLPDADHERRLLTDILPSPIVLREPAPGSQAAPDVQIPTRSEVLRLLADCAFAHFACHGKYDNANPSSNHLLLHDHDTAPLTVAHITQVQLTHARLAYLSACGTAAVQGDRLPDEFIHLASAFQLAGFPHVIATLWQIGDRSAYAVAKDFYVSLSDEDGALDVAGCAYALHEAIRTQREKYPNNPSRWAAFIHVGA
jgi:tetratricopeptide (TPR) repeat protein